MSPLAQPAVSIVVPAYNHARYLPQALDSLLAQDYPHLEVIVLDDGSTDETPQVLERYTGRLHWERQANLGQGATLNRGWQMARGEALGYLSADDVLDPSAISTLVSVLTSEPDTVLVYPDYHLIDARGEVVKTVKAPEFDYARMLSTWVCPPGPGALFRRATARAAGYWDTDLRLTPDYDFWLRVGLHGRCRRVPLVLAGFRVHDESQTFAAVPAERSDEYVRVTTDYYSGTTVPAVARKLRAQAMSSAYLMAARSHLRSARYRIGLRRAATALRIYPCNLRPRTIKLLGHGLFAHHRLGSRTAAPIDVA